MSYDREDNVDVNLRFMNANDIDAIKSLCTECFPVEYPEYWYQNIATNEVYYSLVATYNDDIVGMIVAEVKQQCKCLAEDKGFLAAWFSSDTKVAYVLSLGVKSQFRKRGIASLLLNQLFGYLDRIGQVVNRPELILLQTPSTISLSDSSVKAVYLHVLAANRTAVCFYEHHGFRRHLTLPNYYMIDAKLWDAYTYVKYINGGTDELPLTAYLLHLIHCLFSLSPILALQQLFRWLYNLCSYTTIRFNLDKNYLAWRQQRKETKQKENSRNYMTNSNSTHYYPSEIEFSYQSSE